MHTTTETYTRLHEAFVKVAAEETIVPFAVRVLLAIDDAGGSAQSDTLEAMLASPDGSQIRRELVMLYRTGHAVGVGGDGKRRRRGIRTRVSLTERGKYAVQKVRHYISDIAKAA